LRIGNGREFMGHGEWFMVHGGWLDGGWAREWEVVIGMRVMENGE
jgi:hypothetical protein